MGRGLARIAEFQLARCADEHVEHPLGHVLLQAEQAERRAALTGGTERRRDHVVHDLFGQRRRIDDHGIDAAGLGDQRHDQPAFSGEGLIDGAADFGRAREGDADDARIGDEAGADLAVAEHELQRGRRNAGFVQQRHRASGDERRLLGRLGDHGVAGDERGADLAEKDGEGKVPRTDADKDAAAAITQDVALAGRPRHRRIGEAAARLRGVVAAIIDRLAPLGERIVQGLAAFGLQQSEKLAAMRFKPPGGALERSGALADRRLRPGRKT